MWAEALPVRDAARVVEYATETAGACAGYISLVTEDGARLEIRAIEGVPFEVDDEANRIVPLTMVDSCFPGLSGRSALFSSIRDMKRSLGERAGPVPLKGEAVAVVPLSLDGHTFGAVGLLFPKARAFGKRDVSLMGVIADCCAQAVDRARLAAELRRAGESATSTKPLLRVGELMIDLETRDVAVDGVPIELTPSEFNLLVMLAERPGRAFSRREITERLWQSAHIGDGRVTDTHVTRLRRKLERDPAHPERVLTVRGHGYKLVSHHRSTQN